MERSTENYKVERDWRFDLIVRQQPDPKKAETAGAMRKRQRPRGDCNGDRMSVGGQNRQCSD
jgi:hypothetical protein